MNPPRMPEYLVGLVEELRKLPAETEWVELKRNNDSPEEVGEYISALANAAALLGKAHGYLIWGVDDETHEIVGTTVDPARAKKGNEGLENWLLRMLKPKVDFRFYEVETQRGRVVLLEVPRAVREPVQFQGTEYIRVGPHKKKLKDHAEKEAALWRIFDQTPFEAAVAKERVSDDEVLRLLDYPIYFKLLEAPLPENKDGILSCLEDDALIRPCPAGGWDIMNLGAVLFANQLADFPGLKRKAVRVIQYKGGDRLATQRELEVARGYACVFADIVTYIGSLLPVNEVIEQALRRSLPMAPAIAVRETVANALIHQDFFVTGAGPMVEVFSDRLEVTNPGAPLVDASRFLDSPPRSRNESLASLARRMRMCEERGSGIDKVVASIEAFQLPPPLFELAGESSTRVVLFGPRPLAKMDKDERVRACYLHACLKYVGRDYLTNASLRERFAIEPKNKAMASRLIREAIDAGSIAAHDPEAPPAKMKYVPWWAAPQQGAGPQ